MVGLSPLARVRQAVLDVLFPSRCVGCGAYGSFFCSSCQAELPRARPPRCPVCWQPQRQGDACGRCREERPAFQGARSLYLYQGVAREAVHALKYNYLSALAQPMAQLMARYVEEEAIEADLLVAVPLYARRQRLRGYNQSFLLAREVSRRLNLPLAAAALVRRNDTPPQARASEADARRRNVAGAFDCRPGAVAGRRVLLVDDVTTTGATLDACARALLAKGGASSVWALTFARED